MDSSIFRAVTACVCIYQPACNPLRPGHFYPNRCLPSLNLHHLHPPNPNPPTAQVDVLATCASALAAQMNEEREEDLMRLAGPSLGVSFDAIQGAEMLWVDQYGVTVRVWLDHGVREARVAFLRTVRDERDARSLITMMAQAAWEADKQ